MAIGLAVQGVTYVAAPFVVAIAEHEFRQAGRFPQDRVGPAQLAVVTRQLAQPAGVKRRPPGLPPPSISV